MDLLKVESGEELYAAEGGQYVGKGIRPFHHSPTQVAIAEPRVVPE